MCASADEKRMERKPTLRWLLLDGEEKIGSRMTYRWQKEFVFWCESPCCCCCCLTCCTPFVLPGPARSLFCSTLPKHLHTIFQQRKMGINWILLLHIFFYNVWNLLLFLVSCYNCLNYTLVQFFHFVVYLAVCCKFSINYCMHVKMATSRTGLFLGL